jgi:hypothetical protein
MSSSLDSRLDSSFLSRELVRDLRALNEAKPQKRILKEQAVVRRMTDALFSHPEAADEIYAVFRRIAGSSGFMTDGIRADINEKIAMRLASRIPIPGDRHPRFESEMEGENQ